MRLPSWFRSRTLTRQSKKTVASRRRRLAIELLEDRNVLAGLAVVVEDAILGGGINSTNESSSPSQFIDVSGTTYFRATDGQNGFGLWKIDLTGAAATVPSVVPGLSIDPDNLTNVNGSLYFIANDGVNGRELWRVNGTGLTEMVEDSIAGDGINTSGDSLYSPSNLTNVNGTLYFQATDGTNGLELWRINSGGTAVMVDGPSAGNGIHPGPADAFPQHLLNVNGTLYFSAGNADAGQELFRINSSGNAEVVDAGLPGEGIRPAQFSSYPRNLTNVSGTLYFSATDDINPNQLWKLDVNGAPVNVGAGTHPEQLTNVNGTLFYSSWFGLFAEVELARINALGNEELVEDSILNNDGIGLGTFGSNPQYLSNVNGVLYFAANDSVNGQELWRASPTGNAEMIDASVPGNGINPGAGNAYPSKLTNVNGTVYFQANDGTHGIELWRHNGLGPAEMIEDGVPGEGIYVGTNSPYIGELTNVNGTLYFRGRITPTNPQTLQSDLLRINSSGIVEIVEDSIPGGGIGVGIGSYATHLANVNGTLYFQENDGFNGFEAWRINTSGIAELVEDAIPDGGINSASAYSTPNLRNLNGTLYFTATDFSTALGVNGRELWRFNSQGIAEMVEDANPGGGINMFSSSDPAHLVEVNGTVFFFANDGINGGELWRINSAGIAELVEDSVAGDGIRAGSEGSAPSQLTNVNGTLYFTAFDTINGAELWFVNVLGVAEIVNSNAGVGIRPGNAGSNPNNLTNINGTLFFDANDGTNGRELWRVTSSNIAEMVEDGTLGGGISPGAGHSNPTHVTDVNGTVFFRATDVSNGYELWMLNGMGTAIIVDDAISGAGIVPGAGSSNPSQLTNFNGSLYFSVNFGELWRVGSSGIAEIVDDSNPGIGISPAGNASTRYLTNSNGTLYFSANDGTNGPELWRIGAGGFAEMVEDTVPGGGISILSAGSYPRFLTDVNGTLYFRASHHVTGFELWRINGQGIAEMVEDSIPGGGINSENQYAIISYLENINGTLYLQANDGINGAELWRVNSSGIAEMVEDTVAGGGLRPGAQGSEPYQFTNVNGTLFFSADGGFATGREVWMIQTDPLISISFTSTSQTIDEDFGTPLLIAQLSAPAPTNLSIPITVGGTATNGSDFTLGQTSIQFAAGATTASIPLVISDDLRVESTETISLTLNSASGVILGANPTILFTINDDDTMPVVSFTTFSQVGPEGSTLGFSAILDHVSDDLISVPITFSGSASPSDFSGPMEFVFSPGQLVANLVLSITDDTLGESAELIIASLGNPVNAALANPLTAPIKQFISIPQNDAPTVSFASSLLEASESDGSIFVQVQLSNISNVDTVIPFTIGGTADAFDRTIATTTPITIPAGQTTGTIEVQLINDLLNEPGLAETVELRLQTPTSSNAILGSTQTSVVQIADNDIPRVQFVVNTSTATSTKNGVNDFVWENGGTITYTVTLSLPSTGPVSVPISVTGTGNVSSGYATRSSTGDFTALVSSIEFEPGQTTVTRTITIRNDTNNEDSETIQVSLFDPTVGDAILGKRAKQTITIKDNDPLVSVKGSVNTVSEAIVTKTFTISLTDPTNVPVVVPLTWGGTADRKGTDFDYSTTPSFPSSVTIPAGQKSVSIDVNIREDAIDEKSETIILTAKEPAGEARLSKTPADTITILDDDSPPSVSWVTGAKEVVEGGKAITYKLKLNRESGLPVTVDLGIHEHGVGIVRDTEQTIRGIFGIILNPRDFGVVGTSSGDKVVIPAGETEAAFKVVFYDDSRYEGDEYVTLKIESAVNAAVPKEYKDQARTLKIRDNESPPATVQQQQCTPTSTGVSRASNEPSVPFTIALATGVTSSPGCGLIDVPLGVAGDSGIAIGTSGSGSVGYGTGSLAIDVTGGGSAGLFEGATVFFDANFNGRADFLDLNSDGIEDDDEPLEPTAITGIDGAFSLLLPIEFDVNLDGAIGADEGRLVMMGGIDTSIGLPAATRLSAPLGTPLLTPLSTIVESLMRVEGLLYSDAKQRVSEAFSLGNADFATTNPVFGAVDNDGLATTTERSSVKLSNTVIQIARLFAGIPGAPPVDFLADIVYAEVGNRISTEGSSLDLSVTPVVADLISGVSLRMGLPLDSNPAIQDAIVDGVAGVIAGANERMDALNNTGDVAFLTQLFKIKKVMQVQAAAALQQVTAGTETLSNTVAAYTGVNLDALITASTIGQFIPPSLTISDGIIVEGNAGQQILELTVNLLGDHSLPVSVEYSTGDDTASEADNDYVAATGTLNWAANDNTPRTIQILVNGDTTFETDENLKVFLSNATNAALRKGLGYAFIKNDEAWDTTPVASSSSNLHSLAIGSTGFALQQNSLLTQIGDHAAPLVATIRGTDNVDDTFQLDLSAGSYRADNLTFVGGGGTGFDEVEVSGGTFATITQRLTNATDGQTIFDQGDGASIVTLNWIGMEPFLLNVGSVADLIFELPAGVTDAVLEDADPTNADSQLAGKLRLRSPSGAFENTVFASPSNSIRIRGGNGADSLTIGDLDPNFAGTIRIDRTAIGFDGFSVTHSGWTPSTAEAIDGLTYDTFTKGMSPDLVTLQIQSIATPIVTITSGDAVYNNAVYVATISIAGNNLPTPPLTFTYYSDAGGTNIIAAPENVGTFYVRAFTAANVANSAAQSAIASFQITPFAVTGSITAADKVFDGNTNATILTRTLTGVLGSDSIAYVGGTATFDTAAVGNGKTVTATGLSLSGADAGNYSVNSTAITTADITSPPDTTAPTVTSIIAASSSWTPLFVDAVDGGGVGTGNGLGINLSSNLTIPNVGGIDRIFIQFSEPVIGFSASTVKLLGVNTSDYTSSLIVSYDSLNMRGVIQVGIGIVKDKLRVGVSDAVTDAALNALDGDSNASAGGIFNFRFNVLVGDANNDRSVNGGDLSAFALSFNQTAGNANYNWRADWNSDRSVNGGDLSQFAGNFNQSLPTSEPGSINFPPPPAAPPEDDTEYAPLIDDYFTMFDEEEESLLFEE